MRRQINVLYLQVYQVGRSTPHNPFFGVLPIDYELYEHALIHSLSGQTICIRNLTTKKVFSINHNIKLKWFSLFDFYRLTYTTRLERIEVSASLICALRMDS